MVSSAQELKIPTIDDLIELPEVSDPQISPDGNWIAYTVRKPDWEQNQFIQQIWLVGINPESKPRQLTFSKASSESPRWSPDGQWLAFLSKRNSDESTQIYRLSPFGGEAERLTKIEQGVSDFYWAPDNQQIAIIATRRDSEADEIRREKYGDFQIEDGDHKHSQAWLLNIQDRKVIQLTNPLNGHIVEIDWHPDDHKLVMLLWPTPSQEHWDQGRLAILDINTQEVTWLPGIGYSNPRWSPDGIEVAFTRKGNPAQTANETLYAFNLDYGNERTLLKDFDENPTLLDWTEQGIVFLAHQRTEHHAFLLNPITSSVQKISPVNTSGLVSFDISVSKDGKKAALAAFTQTEYKDIYIIDLQNGFSQKLTSYDELTQGWQLGQSEVIQWNSLDGTPIEGVLTRSANFNPQTKYPLLVILHGGPNWFSSPAKLFERERKTYPMHQWVAKGALILQVNYRGSAGYGEAFRMLNLRNLGLGDYWDVISGVDHLIEKGWVDQERVGVMGWSQGGYISAFITTYSDRFKAVSVGAGISNWITYYTNTDIHPFTIEYLEAKPWEDMEIYKKTSPMTYINQARTPTLIQHGEFDKRVPIPNAYELYQGLKDKGVETKLVIYKGMGHSITKPRQTRQVMEENFHWFNRWIWGEDAKPETPPPCYIALCGQDKDESKDNLPALKRYKSTWIKDVYDRALCDQADFRIFSDKFGLISADESIPRDDLELEIAQIEQTATKLADQMRSIGWKKIIVFTSEPSKDSASLIYLGCIQIAAGISGKINVEHKVVSDKGW